MSGLSVGNLLGCQRQTVLYLRLGATGAPHRSRSDGGAAELAGRPRRCVGLIALDDYRHNHPSLPKEVEQDFDRGYKGVEKDFPGLKCAIPFKKRGPGRGHRGEKAPDLTPEQKAFNKQLSKERVVVEHTISRLKKFGIFGQEFRNRLRFYDRMTDIVCGMINARITNSW